MDPEDRAMEPLPNPAENTCFGCGPANPAGLHLAFERDGDTVRCRIVPAGTQTGWPGLFHTGLHFTVLYEASYWAALTLQDRVMISTGAIVFRQDRLPRVGVPCTATATLAGAGSEPALVRTRAVTVDDRGRECGVLEAEWKPSSRAAVERAGLQLPGYLLEDMGP